MRTTSYRPSGSSDSRSSRRWVVAGGLAALLVAFAMGRATAPTTVERVPAPASGDAKAGALRIVAGIPVGYVRTKRGAVAAALNYGAAAGPGFMFDRRRRLQVAAAIGTPGYARQWSSPDVDRGYGIVAHSLVGRALRAGRPAVARGTPLGYRVVAFDGRRLVLDTWSVYVLASMDSAPVARFGTSRSVLVWWDDDWKVADAYDIGIGPTPTLVRADRASAPVAFMAAIRGMRAYRYVP
jgi:hypothetical protein